MLPQAYDKNSSKFGRPQSVSADQSYAKSLNDNESEISNDDSNI